MPAPVTGGVISGAGGGVSLVISPPVEFILKQSGAFQRMLVTEMDTMYEMFKPVLGAMEAEMWATNGRGAWPPLAQSTIDRKGHDTILVDTTDLRSSLVDPGSAMTIMGVNAEYGTDIEYALYHQDGTPRMPQRQVIPDPMPVDDRRKLEVVMVKWIDRIAAATWGRI